MTTITIELRTEDAEPILREAALEAARFGSLIDHVTRRTYNVRHQGHGESLEDAKARWRQRFLKGKRMVEAFGVDYEMVSEGETLSVHWPDKVLKSTIVTVGNLMRYRRIDKSVPDPKRAMPECRGEIHEQACKAAAERTVRRWRETLTAAAA